MKKSICIILSLLMLSSLSSCRKAGPIDSDIETDNVKTENQLVTSAPKTDVEETDEDSTASDTAATEAVADETTSAATKMDEGKAVAIARDYLGETDPDSGYAYSYQFDSVTAEGNYKVKVSIYIEENERFSTCGYLIVTPDGEVSKYNW